MVNSAFSDPLPSYIAYLAACGKAVISSWKKKRNNLACYGFLNLSVDVIESITIRFVLCKT